MRPRVEIDLNVRSGVDRTYAGFEDVEGEFPAVGDWVEVFESESGLTGLGQIVEVRDNNRILVLAVRFSSLAGPLPAGVRMVEPAGTRPSGSVIYPTPRVQWGLTQASPTVSAAIPA